MDKNQFKTRTKAFAIEVAKFCRKIPYDPIIKHYICQLVRSSASVGANYRAACRGKSKPDFINKMRIVEEEADESMYSLNLFLNSTLTEKMKLRFCIRSVMKFSYDC